LIFDFHSISKGPCQKRGPFHFSARHASPAEEVACFNMDFFWVRKQDAKRRQALFLRHLRRSLATGGEAQKLLIMANDLEDESLRE
jgi:hypothetical protein